MKRRIFVGAKAFTMTEDHKEAHAFVVEGGRFIYVGLEAEALTFNEAEAEVIDLEGNRVIPGLNDSHMHFISYALSKAKVDLRGCRSLVEVEEAIKSYLAVGEEGYFGEWILGHGWNEECFIEPQLPTAEFLDKLCKDRPIYLSRACYHVCAVNSAALRKAGIYIDTTDPEGGKIDRYPSGEATGILRENALLLPYNLIPITTELQKIKQLIEVAMEDALKVGLTSVQTEDFGHFEDFKGVIDAYRGLEESGGLKLRVNLQMLLPSVEKLKKVIEMGIRTGDGNDYLRLGPLKLLADGSLGGRTAALEEPYFDDKENDGLLIYDKAKLRSLLSLASRNGLQPAVHAIGDRAMNQVMDIYEEIYSGLEDYRPRLIHCQITNNQVVERMSRLKVVGDIQPGFLPTDLRMVSARIGDDRAKESYGWKTMLKKGVRIAGSSDAPIESFNPFLGIYSAVTRRDYEGNPEGGWNPQECLTLEEALELYTVGASYATFEEGFKGRIQEGYLADFIVLDRDIFAIDEAELKDVKVMVTYVGGECRFKSTSIS